MDPIIKQTIINIAMEAFIAGASGKVTPSDFMDLVNKLLDQAEETVKDLDPDYAIN